MTSKKRYHRIRATESTCEHNQHHDIKAKDHSTVIYVSSIIHDIVLAFGWIVIELCGSWTDRCQPSRCIKSEDTYNNNSCKLHNLTENKTCTTKHTCFKDAASSCHDTSGYSEIDVQAETKFVDNWPSIAILNAVIVDADVHRASCIWGNTTVVVKVWKYLICIFTNEWISIERSLDIGHIIVIMVAVWARFCLFTAILEMII